MKLKFFIILPLLNIYNLIYSQHCGWDNTFIIIVEVKDALTDQKINNLKISLVDSKKRPYTSGNNAYNLRLQGQNKQNDTLIFCQNLNSKPDSSKDQRHLTLSKENYFLIVYANNYPNFNKNEKDKIKVEDPGGKYKTSFINFKQAKIFSLCTIKSYRSPITLNDDTIIRVKMKK